MGDDPNSNGDRPTDVLDNWPRLPYGVAIHATVDLTLDDPCYVPEIVSAGHHRSSHRRCVATKQNGDRCASRAMHRSLTCPLHGGRLRPEDGGKARRAQRQERERHAESVLALQRLGTRAVVAEALVAEAANVDKAVRVLCDAAAKGDIAAAKALIPWLDQALGRPVERREFVRPTTLDELEQMDEADLERLVAEGRERRLKLVEQPEKTPDWRGRSVPPESDASP